MSARGRLWFLSRGLDGDRRSVPRYPGVVPGADPRLRVEEVHLALHRRSLLCLDRKYTPPHQLHVDWKINRIWCVTVCNGETGADHILLVGPGVGGRGACSGGCARVLWSPGPWFSEYGSPD